MKIKIAQKDFDVRQRRLLKELVVQIRRTLQDSGLSGSPLRELTENLSFAVTSIVDGCQVIKHGQKNIRPFLTFADEGSPPDLIAAEGGSFLHEIAFDAVDSLFVSSDDDYPDYAPAILEFCRRYEITVPPGFHRETGASRYAVIRLDRQPHKLVATTWGTMDDLRRYFKTTIARELAQSSDLLSQIRILDFELRQYLVPVQGWYFAPSQSFQ